MKVAGAAVSARLRENVSVLGGGGFATLDIRPCRKCGAAWSEG